MTIQITPATTPSMIRAARHVGVVAGKIYPKGVTTNSENGVERFRPLYGVFEAMEWSGMRLLLHGELPGVDSIDREERFLKILRQLAKDFPHLPIVLEHVSTAAAVRCVEELGDNVAATITAHHCLLTMDTCSAESSSPTCSANQFLSVHGIAMRWRPQR